MALRTDKLIIEIAIRKSRAHKLIAPQFLQFQVPKADIINLPISDRTQSAADQIHHSSLYLSIKHSDTRYLRVHSFQSAFIEFIIFFPSLRQRSFSPREQLSIYSYDLFLLPNPG